VTVPARVLRLDRNTTSPQRLGNQDQDTGASLGSVNETETMAGTTTEVGNTITVGEAHTSRTDLGIHVIQGTDTSADHLPPLEEEVVHHHHLTGERLKRVGGGGRQSGPLLRMIGIGILLPQCRLVSLRGPYIIFSVKRTGDDCE
jgi:hypothetical protein